MASRGWGLALMATWVGGCGAADEEGLLVDSGLDGLKTVAALSQAEATQFCDAVARSTRAVVSHEKLCVLRLMLRVADAAECQDAVPACVTDLEANDTLLGVGPFVPDCGVLGEGARFECPVTIGELEACYSEALTLAGRYVNRFSCADVGDLDKLTTVEAGAPHGVHEIPSCAPIAQQCSGLFEMQVPMCTVEGLGTGACCELVVDEGTTLGACLDGMCTNGAQRQPGCPAERGE